MIPRPQIPQDLNPEKSVVENPYIRLQHVNYKDIVKYKIHLPNTWQWQSHSSVCYTEGHLDEAELFCLDNQVPYTRGKSEIMVQNEKNVESLKIAQNAEQLYQKFLDHTR